MNETLLDPTEKTLTIALERFGTRLAGERAGEVFAAVSAAAEGRVELDGVGVAPARLYAAWWTDPAGRRHVRVYTYDHDEDSGAEAEVSAVCRVYPGCLFAVRAGAGEEQTLAVCGCGTVGNPDALGWAGDRCGPCADAAMEGRAIPPPAVVYGLSRGTSAVRFSPDGSGLVTGGPGNRLVLLDRRTGERTESKQTNGRHVTGLQFRPDGRAVMAGFWSNHLVRWDISPNRLTLYGEQSAFSQFAPSPDGRFFVCNQGSTHEEIDWTDLRTPLQRRFEATDLMGGGFDRTGRLWVALTIDHAFAVIDLADGVRSVLRSDVFAGLDPGGVEADFFFENLNVFAIDPDHDHVIVAGDDPEHGAFGPAYLGGVRTDKGWRPLPFPEEYQGEMPNLLGFSPDGEWLLYAFDTGGIRLLPTTPDRDMVTVRGLGETELRPGTVAFSPDGDTLACHVPDGGLLWMLPWRRLLSL